ncbi:MAG: tRNA lysidine(34) synthetase TilS [Alphaproteobacteria bacterium]
MCDNLFQTIEAFDWQGVKRVAVAVSGGPDSVALWGVVRVWAEVRGIDVHALHVDHGLRDGSADEAAVLAARIKGLQVLQWDVPSDVRVQEEARKARYRLMAEYCAAEGIGHLLLAHHRDDQAETVLFRLAKGSGLDGLGGMRSVQDYDADLVLVRPFLEVDKADLVAYCAERGVPYFNDPSNENDDFARVRLRQARDVLEGEGLSAKRLAITARRFQRARDALDEIAGEVFADCALNKKSKRIEFDLSLVNSHPEEIVLRVVLRAMAMIGAQRDYAPRLERVEDLVVDLMADAAFRKRTLGGVIFERDDAAGLIILQQE